MFRTSAHALTRMGKAAEVNLQQHIRNYAKQTQQQGAHGKGRGGQSHGHTAALSTLSAGTLFAGLVFSRQKEERGNNQVYTWGYGVFGQLGHGTEKDETAPRVVQFLQDSDCRFIASGGNAASSAVVSRDVRNPIPSFSFLLHFPNIISLFVSFFVLQGELLTFGCGRDSRLGFGEAIDAPNQDTPRVVEGIDVSGAVKACCFP